MLWATARDPEERPKDARALLDRLFETHSSLMTALPTGATPTQRTMVLPGARACRAIAETAVIGSRVALAPATPVSDSTAALTTVAARRRRRGWWIAGIIALVVAIAATTGWYFGAGPGSRVTIPDSLAGLSEADARVALTDLGLVVLEATGQIDSPPSRPVSWPTPLPASGSPSRAAPRCSCSSRPARARSRCRRSPA